MKLTKIKGVGKATERDLIAAGYNTVEDLPSDPAELAKLDFNEDEVAHVLELKAELEKTQADLAQDTADKEAAEAEAAAKAAEDAKTAAATDSTPAASAESSNDLQDAPDAAASTSDENAQEPAAAQPPLPDATPNDANDAAETIEPANTVKSVSLVLTSGAHKGRTVTFNDGDPAVRFADGAFASLESIDVIAKGDEFQNDDGKVSLIFVWGISRSGGVLSKAEFDFFAGEVRKKSSRPAQMLAPGRA